MYVNRTVSGAVCGAPIILSLRFIYNYLVTSLIIHNSLYFSQLLDYATGCLLGITCHKRSKCTYFVAQSSVTVDVLFFINYI